MATLILVATIARQHHEVVLESRKCSRTDYYRIISTFSSSEVTAQP